MKTAGVIGQRIVAVRQGRISRGNGYRATNAVFSIVLANGRVLRPLVHEGESDYSVDFAVSKPTKTKKP